MKNKYAAFLREVSGFIPAERIYTDELRLLAWGTDAGFYRLIPKIVIRSASEQEVFQLMKVAAEKELPVTFRAAGTSLSGQSISDSILIVAGKHWENYKIGQDASTITLQPGLIGERVNEILKPFKRKFTPDPASLKSAMVGGIVMNNASGMSCGTHANSDRMLLTVRLVWWDGTVLDTGNEESKKQFRECHPEVIRGIQELREKVLANTSLTKRIRDKYKIKNVTGLNLLPFLLYEDPFEILTHLIVGSEGTLAFLSEMTMKTIADEPCKASAMLYFRDIHTACKAVLAMKESPVNAAELLDCKSLQAVKDPTGENLTALLVQVEASTPDMLRQHVGEVEAVLQSFETVVPVCFTDKQEEYARYWAIRSGIFPSVGGMRPSGTTCLIEDVAFPLEHLPEATVELQEILQLHGYEDACIYGHALEGNYHFIINQSFDTQAEVDRYERLMDAVLHLVVDKYDGSLKAEHGTGRNMAPFVSYEWGEEAFAVMKEIKKLFDPKGLLNPGVIFNEDPQCHIKHFKPLPETHPVIDKCIECGFCEKNCLTCGLTLSSRQRIVIRRELSHLEGQPEAQERYHTLQKEYQYAGNETCIADGLCAQSCPMGINMGELTHIIREQSFPKGSIGYKTGNFTANHFQGVKSLLRPVLWGANLTHSILGTRRMKQFTSGIRYISGGAIPQWNEAMPKAYKWKKQSRIPADLKVVYFPSCLNQSMGVAKDSPYQTPLVDKTVGLLQKAGYEVIFPENMEALCCGTIWESKGMPDIANCKSKELEEALWKASKEGTYPVLCDQSPCLYRMRHTMERMKLYEPVEFITTYLSDRLVYKQTDRPVAVHITCSTRKMGLDRQLIRLAQKCSSRVLVPEEIGCCGFGGDKGFTHPEVNRYALRKLRPQILASGAERGYSNSRTCEIGLTVHAEIPYQSIVYLVDECTERKE